MVSFQKFSLFVRNGLLVCDDIHVILWNAQQVFYKIVPDQVLVIGTVKAMIRAGENKHVKPFVLFYQRVR